MTTFRPSKQPRRNRKSVRDTAVDRLIATVAGVVFGAATCAWLFLLATLTLVKGMNQAEDIGGLQPDRSGLWAWVPLGLAMVALGAVVGGALGARVGAERMMNWFEDIWKRRRPRLNRIVVGTIILCCALTWLVAVRFRPLAPPRPPEPEELAERSIRTWDEYSDLVIRVRDPGAARALGPRESELRAGALQVIEGSESIRDALKRRLLDTHDPTTAKSLVRLDESRKRFERELRRFSLLREGPRR